MKKIKFNNGALHTILLFFLLVSTVNTKSEPTIPLPSTMILLHELDVLLNSDGSYKLIEFKKEQALTDEGKTRLSVQRIPFDPSTTEIKLLEAGFEEFNMESGKPVSKTIPISIANARIKDHQSEIPGVNNLKTLEFTFDGIKPKGMIWYKLEKKEKSRTGSKVFSMNLVTGYGETELSSVATITSDKELHIQMSGPTVFQIEKKFDGKKHRTKVRTVANIAPYSLKELATFSLNEAKAKIPRVYITSEKDWSDIISNAMKPYNAAVNEKSPIQLDPIIKQLKSMSSNRERVEQILSWLSVGMTYSTRWLGNNPGYVPRKISAIVQSKVGDCKDYAALTLHLMKAAGIKAEPVLVGMFHPGDPSRFLRKPINSENPLPGEDYFNHVVVRYSDGGKSYIIDPGRGIFDATTLPFFLTSSWMLPLGELNNKMFLSASASGSDYAKANVDTVFTRKPDGQFMAESKVTLFGELANYIRMVAYSKGEPMAIALIGSFGSVGAHSNLNVEKVKPIGRDTAPLEFKISYNLGKSLESSSQQKLILMPHLLPIMANMVGEDVVRFPSFDFELEEKRTIKKGFVFNEAEFDCLALGPSLSLKRTVENVNDDVVISDFIKQNNWSYEPQTELEKKQVESLAHRVGDCFERSEIAVEESGKANQMSLAKSLSKISHYEEPLRTETSLLVGRVEMRKIDHFVKLSPDNHELYNKKAKLMAEQGYLVNEDYVHEYLVEAEKILQLALNKKPTEATHHARLGKYQIFRGDQRAAMISFKNASALAPKNFYVLQLGGDLSNKQNQLENALAYFKAAEVASVDTAQRKIALSEQIKLLCGKLNKCSEAIPAIDKMLIVDGTHPWTLNNMAVMYQKMGNYAKAIELLRKAIGINSFGAARTNLVSSIVGEVRLRMKNRQPASVVENKKIEDLLVEGYKVNPKNFELLHVFVEYHLELAKQKPEALKLAKNYLDELKTSEGGNIFLYFELEKKYKVAAGKKN